MNKVLNKEQQEAVEFGDGPLLIIAGAGTGKTTVITEKVAYLINKKKVKPEEILALTFTEKAASEMQERIDKLMPYGYTQMWIATFHSFCDTILRQEGINIGLSPNFKLMTETDSIMLLKKNIFKLDLNYFRPLGNPTKFIEALLIHFARLGDEDITSDEYLKYATSLKNEISTNTIAFEREEEIEKIIELANVFKKYEKLKEEEGTIDFANLISLTLKLFRTRKNILKNYQDQFKFILVDEFQDTNFAQNELAIILAGYRKNITVVADDDQAIYRWRGAALSNVIQFRNNFPGSKIITLTKNYRSTREILDRSYMLIQHNNPNRLEVMENINKKLTSERNIQGSKIELIVSQRVDEEAENIANEIKKLTKDKYSYSDIAILVRANNHSQPITQALQRAKIPYQFLGPAQLFHQEEIKDLIAYLKVLYNLQDTVALYRILSMDVFKIPERDLNFLLASARKKNLSLFEMLELIQELPLQENSIKKITQIKDMVLRHLTRTKKDTGGQILYYFLVDTKLFNKFLEFKTEKEEQIAQNVASFFDKIKTFETLHSDAGIFAIVDWIDLMMELGDSPLISELDWRETNAVNILTVHSSKGLEFPVVFVVNLVNDRFPTRERKEKIPLPQNLIKEILPQSDYHIEEERRLFYVGMTRAKDLLYFTAAKYYAEAKREKKISQFVYEALPEELKRQGDTKKQPTQLSLIKLTQNYFENPDEKVMQESRNNFKLNYLSFSHIQSFDICPLHYKAKFILNLPSPQTAPLSFGVSMHTTLKDLYESHKKNQAPALEELFKLLRKNWISEGYTEKSHEEQMFENGKRILKEYYTKYFNLSKKPLATELPFSFIMPRPDDKKSHLKIAGKIDRIDSLDGNGIEIIDYKTGQSQNASKKSYELQLGLYALAATKVNNELLGKKVDDITVTLFYLENCEKISGKVTEKQLKMVEDEIWKKVQQIESSDFKCSKSVLCINCEYKMLCNTS